MRSIDTMPVPMNDSALADLTRQIQRNCDISDACHADMYTICTLALRLREMYKWAHGLEPWIEHSPPQVLEWIDGRERLWESLAGTEIQPLTLAGRTFDAFDFIQINRLLEPINLYYTAGYAHGLKPTFALAPIRARRRMAETPFIELGTELARDILSLPAFTQDDGVVLRRAAARTWLWDQIFYIKASGRPALTHAMTGLRIDARDTAAIQCRFDEVEAVYDEILIAHEIGELASDGLDRDLWRAMVAAWAETPAELAARAVKDLIADTGPSGTLAYLLNRKNPTAVSLHAAFFDGLPRHLFPQWREAVEGFIRTQDWVALSTTRRHGYRTACDLADRLTAIYHNGEQTGDHERSAQQVACHILGPLTRK